MLMLVDIVNEGESILTVFLSPLMDPKPELLGCQI